MNARGSVLLLCFTALMVLACNSYRPTSYANNKQPVEMACGKIPVDAEAEHIDWFLAEAEDMKRLKTKIAPKYYAAYWVGQSQLQRFFEAAGKTVTATVIPLPIRDGCKMFMMKTSATMSEDLKKKYPGLISLSGDCAEPVTNNARLDFDGEKMSGQVTWNGEVFLISPLETSSKTYYLIYKQSDAGIDKGPFEAVQK